VRLEIHNIVATVAGSDFEVVEITQYLLLFRLFAVYTFSWHYSSGKLALGFLLISYYCSQL